MTIDEILTKIVELCKEHDATSVTLFGSRAKGTARNESDIDIAVSGAKEVEELKESIDDLPTLYSVDLVNLDTCKSNLLKEDISKYGRKIFQKI